MELKPGNGAKLIRSAGSFAQIIAQDATIPLFELPLTTSTFLAETVSVSALYALTSTV
jgi:ribosomal protein L2